LNDSTIITQILTFSSIMMGGVLAIKYRAKLNLLEAFAGGVLIALALFDLLPEAIRLSSTETSLLVSVIGLIAVGFVTLYLIENGPSWPPKELARHSENQSQLKGQFMVTELASHGLLEGIAIGLGYGVDLRVGIVIAIAVICHEFAEGLATATALLDSGSSTRSAFSLLLIQAVSPAFGILLTYFVYIPEVYLVFSLPFFAGGFLYLGGLNILPSRHEDPFLRSTLGYSLFGFVAMLIIIIFV